MFWSVTYTYILVCNIHIYMPKMTLSSLLTYMTFFYAKFAKFWYTTCFVPNLIPVWPQSHGLLRRLDNYISIFFRKTSIQEVKFELNTGNCCFSLSQKFSLPLWNSNVFCNTFFIFLAELRKYYHSIQCIDVIPLFQTLNRFDYFANALLTFNLIFFMASSLWKQPSKALQKDFITWKVLLKRNNLLKIAYCPLSVFVKETSVSKINPDHINFFKQISSS